MSAVTWENADELAIAPGVGALFFDPSGVGAPELVEDTRVGGRTQFDPGYLTDLSAVRLREGAIHAAPRLACRQGRFRRFELRPAAQGQELRPCDEGAVRAAGRRGGAVGGAAERDWQVALEELPFDTRARSRDNKQLLVVSTHQAEARLRVALVTPKPR